ncbi:MAG: argininosuccinate lyase [PVC group bacterium]|nr:argininosuccinate lyase [PVC group bacterium]
MAKKLWGGRFKKSIDKDFEEFSKSIQYDYKLAKYDIYHSKIHALALKNSGILTAAESKKIITVLDGILGNIESGDFKFNSTSEDIHTEIQNFLEKKVGKLALKLHTLRSRNDQVVFDAKWFCKFEAVQIICLLNELEKNLQTISRKHKDKAFIGYTHTQRAQVVRFDDYINAYYFMFKRDFQRVSKFFDGLNVYIGAGALAGSSLTKDAYDQAASYLLDKMKELSKIVKPVENSLDNVSDRDFIVEFLSILSIIQMHLSRFSEDMILYSTQEFNYIDLPEEFCTGSSLMPHKKNPDFLELVRGYTGQVNGNLIAVLTTMKGLPLTYNRDMQLDKEPLFSSVEILKNELKIMAKFVKGIKIKEEIIAKALEDECLYATELAEFLVHENVAFKEAHDIVGKLIRYSQDKKVKIREISDKQLRGFHKALNQKEIKKIMTPQYAIKSKKSINRKVLKINA